jgi:thiol-disulfide isomerase/thioredoxin
MLSPVIVLISLIAAQAAPQSSSTVDALALLNEVSQRYADAKAYHIEAVEERTSSNELRRSWQKQLLTAIVMPGGRYRYEGRSGFGSAILVSDGTTKWAYHLHEQLYTQQPVSSTDSEKRRIISQEEYPTQAAKLLVDDLARLSKRLKSATALPDETISMNGHSLDCHVVRYTDDDFKTRARHSDFKETIWIDRVRKVIVKTIDQEQTYLILAGSKAHIPISAETTTLYPVVEFDPQEPETTFRFVPPADAKLVAEFPTPHFTAAEVEPSEFLGKPAPELQLKSADGKLTTLSSYRGKPVFLEFWATWCRPCVDLMPELAKLYGETAQKGLVWLSIDNDEDPADATAFISQEHIPWTNYHDENGSLGEAFHREGIPLGVLIDADGKVTFYRSGYEISDLRNAITKLGAQFGSIAVPSASSK